MKSVGLSDLFKAALPYILTAAIVALGALIIYMILVPPGVVGTINTAVT